MGQRPLIIGHRGASAVAPENTMAAFRAAIAAGADGVEFDVRLSRDRVPVIIHDETLRRTAGLPGRVGKLLSQDLVRTRVAGRRSAEGPFANETIPRLVDLFELFAATTSVLYLELKSDPVEREPLAEVCCQLVNQSALKERVIVECFDLGAIELIKQIDSTVRTAALFEPSFATPPGLSTRRLVSAAKAAGADEVALHHKLAGKRMVQRLKDAGFKVVVWTVDDPNWIPRAESMGVDALITNDPAAMLAR